MECERFKKLLKAWYIQVQDEALAPARMVDFMEQHIAECPTCIMDPEAKNDIAKIITLVLPKDKLKPATRSKKSAAENDDTTNVPEGPDNETADGEETSEETGDDEERDEFADDTDDDSAPESEDL